jgi:hypothetical protein
MKSYRYEIPSSQLDCGQQSFRLQTGNPYGRTLFRHLIATASLAVITVLFWLSLIGLAPSVYAHSATRANPTDQPTSATTSSKNQN